MHISQITDNEYSSFFSRYIKLIPNINLIDELKNGKERFVNTLISILPNKLSYSYAEGKWTLAEVILHCIDTERIFQYRLLRIARNDKKDLAGFDQDIYVPYSDASNRSLSSLITEYTIVRNSTILLIENISNDNLQNSGTIDGNIISARALGFIICGHQYHHETIIKERYLIK